MKKLRASVGIVGCGKISGIYCKNLTHIQKVDVVACTDLDMERAQNTAKQFKIPKACTVDEMMKDPNVDIIVNLTVPKAHAEVALSAVRAGKHVYNEKPLCTTQEQAKMLLREADKRGLRVGCAPDTFLGGGLQTARRLIDKGSIGKPVAATAFMCSHGAESWHPSPEFLYDDGGGPLFDMGPYYLTALVSLMGPVKRVTGSTKISFPVRTITSQPKFGKKIKVKTPTHLAGVLDFENGAIATLVTSFDVWAHGLPVMEIYGSEGTLKLGDPNMFEGVNYVRRPDDSDWQAMPMTHASLDNSRGLGVADMAAAIAARRPHRAHSDMAYHVLDIMYAVLEASKQGKHIKLQSRCNRPKPLLAGLADFEVD